MRRAARGGFGVSFEVLQSACCSGAASAFPVRQGLVQQCKSRACMPWDMPLGARDGALAATACSSECSTGARAGQGSSCCLRPSCKQAPASLFFAVSVLSGPIWHARVRVLEPQCGGPHRARCSARERCQRSPQPHCDRGQDRGQGPCPCPCPCQGGIRQHRGRQRRDQGDARHRCSSPAGARSGAQAGHHAPRDAGGIAGNCGHSRAQGRIRSPACRSSSRGSCCRLCRDVVGCGGVGRGGSGLWEAGGIEEGCQGVWQRGGCWRKDVLLAQDWAGFRCWDSAGNWVCGHHTSFRQAR